MLFVNSKGDTFGPESLSSGERSVMSKLLPLYLNDINGRILLFDEPEDSMHPAWQNRFLGLLRQAIAGKDCQAFVATHSPQIIGSTLPGELYVLTRDDKGQIIAFPSESSPYGWNVEKILSEVQMVDDMRNPEISDRLRHIESEINEGNLCKAREDIAVLEPQLTASDGDLAFLRAQIIWRSKKHEKN